MEAITGILHGKISLLIIEQTIYIHIKCPLIVRKPGKKYAVAFEPQPIANAAKYTRSVPDTFIAANGHDVTKAFLDYARPIVGELPKCEIL